MKSLNELLWEIEDDDKELILLPKNPPTNSTDEMIYFCYAPELPGCKPLLNVKGTSCS